MTSPGRIPCCVPYCRRTAPRERYPAGTEIICGPHWRLARRDRRRIYDRAHRAWRRAHARQIGPGRYASAADLAAAPCAANRADRLWAALKREVVEAAMGIGRADHG